MSVLIVKLGRTVQTAPDGSYEFRDVPPGTYEVLAHMHLLADERRTVEVPPGGVAVLDLQLRLAPVHQEITVTASGREQTTLEAFQSVATLGQLELAPRLAASLGEALADQGGVAKRSSGPGTSRPVIRGFDGDRVLILQDGLPTGTLSSQSGDHGEPVDLSAAERVEVVRGPATLLYGPNAIGGVVNVVSGHHLVHQHPHEGVRGYWNASAGTNNRHVGGGAGFEFGRRDWLLSGSGSGLRTGDYRAPSGTVNNSATRAAHTAAGVGRYRERGFFRLDYGLGDGRYGIPEVPFLDAGPVDIRWQHHSLRFHGSLRQPGAALAEFRLYAAYTDWRHSELTQGETSLRAANRQLSYRGVWEQRPAGRVSGRFGISGVRRAYRTEGGQRLAPPVRQDGLAGFVVEELSLEPVQVQFGARLDAMRYHPEGRSNRWFTGLSASVAVRAPLWDNGAVAASYNHSFRPPALEELYNDGPHPGHLTFEIGDPRLKAERNNGVDLTMRHVGNRLRGDVSLFYYRISGFIFLAPTGQFRHGLVEARYRQGASRYTGAEARTAVRLGGEVWLKLGMDVVDAQLRAGPSPLPRIPPARGKIGLDVHVGGFGIEPEVVLTNAQRQTFSTETPTAGYAVCNLSAAYTRASSRRLHRFTFTLFNAADRLYRNHVSLIKDFTPEIGRGVRFTYALRVF
ncbi:MAG: TonB-dependent receptor [Bryobacterales bacterium]|nr:TonB-dependent receptor [Bryobacteraceae bacterium]MDW8354374.1 TonB-dependent receptor [Bryobacterales bacterium]